MAQIAAAALGVAIDDVRVVSGDIDAVPTVAARSARARLRLAARLSAGGVRSAPGILAMAGRLLQADPSALDIVDGGVVDRPHQ